MDPTTNRPRPDGEPDEATPEVGLVDLVDQALVRLDGLRDRPRLSSALTALLVFLLTVGWGLTRWRAVEPIDDRIPRVGEMVAADAAPPAKSGGEPVEGAPHSAGAGGPVVSPAGTASSTTSTEPESRLVVHVSGAVKVQGLVELASGARLADAISAAGGPTATADIHRLNLAVRLLDGMHIHVPEVGEEGDDSTRPLIETAPTSAAGPNPVDGSRPGSQVGPININRAGLVELERLPGVGPAIAGAVVAWREDNGPFTSIDELLDVPGIGPAKLAAIEDQVTL